VLVNSSFIHSFSIPKLAIREFGDFVVLIMYVPFKIYMGLLTNTYLASVRDNVYVC
jgi:hypothetical protein